MISLEGKWDLRDLSGDYRCDMTLPGDAISALFEAGLIADPYWGRNEYDLRWIAERAWVASRSVELDGDGHVLVLDGPDTIVDVVVNGVQVLAAQNAFRKYRVDLAGVARPGANQIELHFRSNIAEAADRQAAQPFRVPDVAQNCPIPNGNMLRKAHCDFGWDWNIALAPFGVVGGIWLEPALSGRLAHIGVEQVHDAGQVTVHVNARIEGDAEGQPVHFQFGGKRAEANVAGRMARAEIHIADPELWWPAGQGMQPLYDLQVRFGDQVEERQIGLRSVELVTRTEDGSNAFRLRINGRDIFAKGANWIPADALVSRITPDKTRALLQSAADANMNMIRIWGGGRYEADWFYEICDELGLMVWQDFMFSCSLYPATDDFLAEVAAEVRENVERLHHHACIALWCGDNELIGALTWYKESLADRDRYLVAYDRLNRTIEAALKTSLPGAIWWPSSPSPGPLSFGDGWHDDGSGDMHFWSVWYENREFDHYRDIHPLFCSEFGFQSYPSNDVIATFTDPKDRNIAASVFESHQKNAGGNERIAATMFRYFRFPVDFENFVYLSQVQQGLAIKTAVDYWRSLRPHCMGALYWQLNDTWPVCSWSSLNYGGGWKVLHHLAQRFYAPVSVVVVPRDGQLTLRGVNDRPEPVEISVSALAANMDGTMRPLAKGAANVAGSAVDILSVAADALAADEVLALVWQGSDGKRSVDVFAPRPYKSYDLLPPQITANVAAEGAAWTLTLDCAAMAHFVTIEADQPGRFDVNAFALFPGQAAKVTFTPQMPGRKPEFTIRDLHSATYGSPQ